MDDAKIEDEIEKEIAQLDIETHENREKANEDQDTSAFEDIEVSLDTLSVTSNSLLRATICELERALTDTRRLLQDRDKRITELRSDLEKTRKELHKEQKQTKKLRTDSDRTISDLKESHQKEVERLMEEIRELKEILEKNESDKTTTEDGFEIVPCCSSMHELVQTRQKLKVTEQKLKDFRVNNQLTTEQRFYNEDVSLDGPKVRNRSQLELQTQLRLKFLRDAFFYYMIDFHSEEQMKAILAILEYDDRRHDIIIESHSMRRRGKRFTVTEVSSRSLTFVQETG